MGCHIGKAVHHVPLLQVQRVLTGFHVFVIVERRSAVDGFGPGVPAHLLGVPASPLDRTHGTGFVCADIEEVVIAFVTCHSSGYASAGSVGPLLSNDDGCNDIGIDQISLSGVVYDVYVGRSVTGTHKEGALHHGRKAAGVLGGLVEGMRQELEYACLLQEVPGVKIVGNNVAGCLVPSAGIPAAVLAVDVAVAGFREVVVRECVADDAHSALVLLRKHVGPVETCVLCSEGPRRMGLVKAHEIRDVGVREAKFLKVCHILCILFSRLFRALTGSNGVAPHESVQNGSASIGVFDSVPRKRIR